MSVTGTNLAGRVALITGGGQGIGAVCAKALAEAGAAVAITSRSLDKLEPIAAALREGGARAIAIAGDVRERQQVQALVQQVEAALGPVDILVANAGVAASAPFLKTDDALWEQVLSTNLNGTFYCMQAVLGKMIERKWGRIINVASDAGKVGFQYTSAYCASKHAVVGLTRAVALEVAQKGVTVNAICPGFVETQMTEDSIRNIVQKSKRTPEQARAYLESLSPQGRIFQPDEVAALALFLCSEGARGIHGQSIPLDGGSVMS